MTKLVNHQKFRANYQPSHKTPAPHVADGRTKQSDKEAADINNILAKYTQTGVLPGSTKVPMYGDFTSSGDYQESLNRVLEANELFAALPAKARSRFHNDPQQMLAFMEDPENAAEAVKLGLATLPPSDEETPIVAKPGKPEKAPNKTPKDEAE